MSKLTENFILQEFVPKSIYDAYGDRAIRFIDNRIPLLAQAYKDILCAYYKKNVIVTVNNYHIGGQFNERGFREFNTKTGAEFSDHKFGRAFDSSYSFDDGTVIPIKEVYQILLLHIRELQFIGLTTFEDIKDTPTWLHSSTRNQGNIKSIVIVKP